MAGRLTCAYCGHGASASVGTDTQYLTTSRPIPPDPIPFRLTLLARRNERLGNIYHPIPDLPTTARGVPFPPWHPALHPSTGSASAVSLHVWPDLRTNHQAGVSELLRVVWSCLTGPRLSRFDLNPASAACSLARFASTAPPYKYLPPFYPSPRLVYLPSSFTPLRLTWEPWTLSSTIRRSARPLQGVANVSKHGLDEQPIVPRPRRPPHSPRKDHQDAPTAAPSTGPRIIGSHHGLEAGRQQLMLKRATSPQVRGGHSLNERKDATTPNPSIVTAMSISFDPSPSCQPKIQRPKMREGKMKRGKQRHDKCIHVRNCLRWRAEDDQSGHASRTKKRYVTWKSSTNKCTGGII